MTTLNAFRVFASLLLAAFVTPALAASASDFQSTLLAEVRQANPAFKTFSAQRGQAFFTGKHGGDWSCASCHTANPAQAGSHVVTRKPIDAMAPAANPARFSDAGKAEKWFRRNCKDVLSRACTAEEKGDVLAYLMTIKN